jgi:hypothetical protein
MTSVLIIGIGYRLSLSLSKNAAKQNAALKLREAFKKEFLALVPSQNALDEDIPNFLERSFQKHREAIFDYAFYLSSDEKQRLYNAWYTYYCHEQNKSEKSIPFFEQYACNHRGFNLTQKHEMMKKARDRIGKILEFTDNT